MEIVLSLLPAVAVMAAAGIPLARHRRDKARLERELREAKAMLSQHEEALPYRVLLEAVSEKVISYDAALRVRYVNPRLAATLGFDVAAMLGKRPCELTPGDAHVLAYEERLRQAVETGQEISFESEMPAADGIHYASIQLIPVRDAAGRVSGVISIGRDVTERQRAQDALALREREFRALASMAPVAIAKFDLAGRRVYANLAAEKMLGRAAQSGMETGRKASGYFGVVRRVLEWGVAVREEIALRVVHGEAVWGDVEAVPEFDEQGKLSGVLMVAGDISERKRMETLLEKREREFRSLAESSPDLIARFDHECRRLYANQAMAALAGKPVEALVGVSPADGVILAPEQAEKLTTGIRGVFSEGKNARVDLTCVYHDGSMHEFDALLAPEFGADGKVETVLLLSRDISERKRLEKSLHLSEFRWKFALEGSGQGVWDWNLESGEVEYSDRYKSMLGYTGDEFSGRMEEWEMRIHPDDLAATLEAHRVHFDAESPSYDAEFRMRCKDGSWKWIHSRGMVVERDAQGKPLRMIGTHIDVTQRKRMEQALRRREEEFRTLVENSPDPIFRYDREGRRTYVNRAVLELMGIDSGEKLLGGTALDGNVVAADEAQKAHRIIRAAIETGEPGECEVKFVTPDGRPLVFQLRFMPEFAPDGSVASVVSVCRDITALKAAFEALRQKEHNLAESQRIAQVGSWELELASGKLNWSDEIFRILEIDPAQHAASHEAYLEAIHPDDRAMVDEAYAASLKDRAACCIDHRLLLADGRIKHVRGCYKAHYGEDGRPLRSLGTVHDISERKRMEEELRRREQEFRALAEHSPDTIARFDRDCRRTYVNAALTRFLGRPTEALLGSRPSAHFAQPQAVELEAKITAVFESGKGEIHEYVWKAADDSLRTSHIHLAPELDAAGQVCSVLAIGRDISDLKAAEHSLMESRAMLRKLSLHRERENEAARSHVAWEIYDTLGQNLMALRMELAGMSASSDAAARQRIERMTTLTNNAIRVVREVSQELRPVTLDMGLIYGLEWLAEEFERKSGVKCVVQADEDVQQYDSHAEMEIFRIAERALDNVAAHADARCVRLAWLRRADRCLLEVCDDGKGFDLDRQWSSGLGLLDMRERANRLGGELVLLSSPGQGALVELSLPLAEQRAPWTDEIGQGDTAHA